MIFASKAPEVTQTDLRQLEDRMDSRIAIAKNEWASYLVSIEDVLDKIDHIVKRHGKRKKRDDPVLDSAETEPEIDLVSKRVASRRILLFCMYSG